MRARRLNWIAIGKVLLAVVLLTALAGVAGSGLAPQLPVPTLLLYCFLGIAALFGLLLVLAVIQATLGQFILRNGGTDPQWFWFKSEPPGLVGLREQLPSQPINPKEPS